MFRKLQLTKLQLDRTLRSQTQPTHLINVVVSGEVGSGKSSVINLIAGEDVAPVASNLYACTTQCIRYDISFDNMNFAIFDTIGLENPQMGVNSYLDPVEKIHELIVELDAIGGVQLLLFCIDAGHMTETTQAHYRLLSEVLCDETVPIALVFTGLEREVEMEDWWRRNVEHIEYRGFKSHGHACITTVRGGFKYSKSQEEIRKLLKTCTVQNDGLLSWFAKLGSGLRDFIEAHEELGREDVTRVLRRRCSLDPVTAEMIAGLMEKGDPGGRDLRTGYVLSSRKSRTTNVVLFGERSIEKSLVINLIAQKEIAQVSLGRTMQSTRYDISFDDKKFAIFDTVGLEEPQMGINDYLSTIEKAYEFIVKLGAAGGIHLVLFCARKGGITATTQSNYRLFCNFLSGTKVPIILVFTGVEREAEFKDWQSRNKTHVEHYGIGQVTIQDREHPNHTDSQKKLRELLKVYAQERSPAKRDVMQVLTDQCKLDQKTARRIASMMKASGR